MKIVAFHQLDYIENDFLSIINNLINKYPFKIFYFMELFNNKQCVFARDSNIFVELLKLGEEELRRLFEISKILLDKKIINKIIYKKEFIIMKFHSEFILSFFTSPTKWYSIPLYFKLRDLKIPVYYDTFLKHDIIINCMLCIEIDYYHILINDTLIEVLTKKQLSYIFSLSSNENENLLFSFDGNQMFYNLMEKVKKK